MTTLIRRKKTGEYVATFDHFPGYPHANATRHLTFTKDPARALRAPDAEAHLLVDLDIEGQPYEEGLAKNSRLTRPQEFERVDMLPGGSCRQEAAR
jgi:hypothetical protein